MVVKMVCVRIEIIGSPDNRAPDADCPGTIPKQFGLPDFGLLWCCGPATWCQSGAGPKFLLPQQIGSQAAGQHDWELFATLPTWLALPGSEFQDRQRPDLSSYRFYRYGHGLRRRPGCRLPMVPKALGSAGPRSVGRGKVDRYSDHKTIFGPGLSDWKAGSSDVK